MASLQQGSSGPDVTALQNALTKAGYSPGASDGNFGPGTTQAVIAFQKSKGLSADGVAGPQTQAALGMLEQRFAPAPIHHRGGQQNVSGHAGEKHHRQSS